MDEQQQLLHTAIKLLEAYGKKEATGSPSPYYAHGPSGLFSRITGEHPVLNAMVRPSGLLSRLPVIRADLHVNEFIDTVTGVTAESGSEPSSICGTPITAGLTKLCSLVAPFGRVTRQAREWSVLKLGKRRDAFEDMAYQARFPVNMMQGDNLTMGGIASGGSDIARQELGVRLFELAIAFQRKLGPLVYTGNPANNNGEGYMEPIGLDLWINVNNKRDARSSALCTALNSLLMDFNYAKADGSTKSIVQYITQMWRWVNWNAMTMGLAPATWVISMPPDLFNIVTDVWPCAYMSDRCSVGASGANIVVVNDQRNIEMRNEMRNGQFLWIDGVKVPVEPDMFAPTVDWTQNSNVKEGEWAADIYMVPLTVMGGMPVTGWQYFDQRISVAENQIARDSRVWSTDEGMYLWGSSSSKVLCFNMQATLEPRLLMHTPQLAARLQHVKYAPLEHLRDADPNARYFADGGNTSQAIEKFYNQWSSTPA